MSHILIVDDQRSIASLWARGFKSLKYTVTIAYGGMEAIYKMREDGLPDLILLDQVMSVGCGATVLAELEKLDPENTVKIFLITAEPEIFEKSSRLRADRVLHKPVLFRELMQMVQETLSENQQAAGSGT